MTRKIVLLLLLPVYGIFSTTAVIAQEHIKILYAGRNAVTISEPDPVGVGIRTIFNEIGRFRLDLEEDIEAVISVLPLTRSEDVDLERDIILELTGRPGGLIDIKITTFGGDFDFDVHCAIGNITRPHVDVDLTRVEANATFSLFDGLSPFSLELFGFDVDLNRGINGCSFFSLLLSVFGENPLDILEDTLESRIKNAVEQEMVQLFELNGLSQGYLFDILTNIDQAPFDVVNADIQQIIDVVTNPFDGIYIKLKLDEDNNDTSGDDEVITLVIEVPWEQRPIAQFNLTHDGQRGIILNAENSFDPDGGSISYYWEFGDGHIQGPSNTPIAQHTYQDDGFYSVFLVVTDDETVVSTAIQHIDIDTGSGGDATPGLDNGF